MLNATIVFQLLSFILVLLASVCANATNHERSRRSPAVWGDPAPDWTTGPISVQLDSAPFRYMYALLFVDDKITAFYEYDMIRVKKEVLKVVEEANTYFVQLRIGVVVVDILQTMRSDLSLYSFQEYRQARLGKLPAHDFASLMSFRYAGGLAFVEGLCHQPVMLCGFYPQEPTAMGSIFFHEVAHLLGVAHKPANTSIYVPNCACSQSSSSPSSSQASAQSGCLRIPGFDHDCTVQQLSNSIYKQSKCLRHEPMITRSEPICGNGVLEGDEDCDCGTALVCSALNCVPELCRHRIAPAYLWLALFLFVSGCGSIVFFILRRRGFFTEMLNCFKTTKKRAKILRSTVLTSNNLESNDFATKRNLEPCSSVVLLDAPPRVSTLSRPRFAPPPPPPPKTTISVDTREKRDSQAFDRLSWKFDDFDDVDEISPQLLTSYRATAGVPTCPQYHRFAPINRVTVMLHNSRETVSTDLPSSSSSASSGLNNGTAI